MKKFWVCFLALLVVSFILLPMAALADNVTFTSVGGENNGQYYVAPYNLTVNGIAEYAFCVDFNHESNPGTSWTANETSVSNLPPTGTYQAVNPNSNVYSEMAWLASQYSSNTASHVSIQQAIWDLSVGKNGTKPYTDTGTGSTMDWYTQALSHSGYDASGWIILTEVGGTPYASTGGYPGLILSGNQEFLIQDAVPTPEPGTIMLLGSGILGVYGFSRKKRTQLET